MELLPYFDEMDPVLWKNPAREIEVRFGDFKGDKFNSGVKFHQFQRVLRFLENDTLYYKLPQETSTVENYSGNVRKIITLAPRKKIEFQKKDKKYEMDLPNYNVRLSVHTETPLSTQTRVPSNPNFTRERTRHSFQHKSKLFRVDLTKVIGVSWKGNTYQSYEVELEFLGTKSDLYKLDKEATTIHNDSVGTISFY